MNIAILVQTGLLNKNKTISYLKNTFKEDFYLLNWKVGSKDTWHNCGHHFDLGVSWSKGREHLYTVAKSNKEYDYYLFLDDDIEFYTDIKFSLNSIFDLLKVNKPHLLTVQSDCWQDKFSLSLNRKFNYIFISDLQFMILSKELLSKNFPFNYDGGWGTMWPFFNDSRFGFMYAIRLNQVKIINTRSNDGNLYGGDLGLEPLTILSNTFNSSITRSLVSFIGTKKFIWILNLISSFKF